MEQHRVPGPGVVAEVQSFQVRALGPEDPKQSLSDTYFCYEVTATIGQRNSEPGEQFEIHACSPSWFIGELAWVRANSNVFLIWDQHPEILAGHRYWFMDSWAQEDVESAIHLICRRSSPGPDWSTVANRIGRLLAWEWAGIDDDQVNAAAGLPQPERPGS